MNSHSKLALHPLWNRQPDHHATSVKDHADHRKDCCNSICRRDNHCHVLCIFVILFVYFDFVVDSAAWFSMRDAYLLHVAVGVHFPSLKSLLSRRVLAVERAFSLSFATSGTHMGFVRQPCFTLFHKYCFHHFNAFHM